MDLHNHKVLANQQGREGVECQSDKVGGQLDLTAGFVVEERDHAPRNVGTQRSQFLITAFPQLDFNLVGQFQASYLHICFDVQLQPLRSKFLLL